MEEYLEVKENINVGSLECLVCEEGFVSYFRLLIWIMRRR